MGVRGVAAAGLRQLLWRSAFQQARAAVRAAASILPTRSARPAPPCSARSQGAVQALAAAGDMLFSAGQDQSLRVWKLDPAANQWGCVATLKVEQGGHRAPISCLWASHPLLFSADYLGTLKVGGGGVGVVVGVVVGAGPRAWCSELEEQGCSGLPAWHRIALPRRSAPPAPPLQVWDLTTGSVRQTVEKAHSGSEIPCITNLTVWEVGGRAGAGRVGQGRAMPGLLQEAGGDRAVAALGRAPARPAPRPRRAPCPPCSGVACPAPAPPAAYPTSTCRAGPHRVRQPGRPDQDLGAGGSRHRPGHQPHPHLHLPGAGGRAVLGWGGADGLLDAGWLGCGLRAGWAGWAGGDGRGCGRAGLAGLPGSKGGLQACCMGGSCFRQGGCAVPG